MHEHERRAVVRSLYGERCGYCSVHETEAGATLEIDHFQPRSVDGGDDLDNLGNYSGLLRQQVSGRRGLPLRAWLRAAKMGWPCLRRVEM